ncbi:NAD(P)-binding protein [Peniophora sp. CONT]|nr:NAD(P)-binding protein [Peniophora sp. CONT]
MVSTRTRALWSSLSQIFPPRARWSVNDIPDLSGKVALVTGGNAGCGRETVKALLTRNAKVYLAARSESKAQKAIEELKDETGKEALFLQLDLADLSAVRSSADSFLSQEPKLHMLVNNAGVMAPPVEMTTAQGYDLQAGTNVVGHYLFTTLLLPALLAASEPGQKARVVTTSSIVHYRIDGFHFDWTVDGDTRRKVGSRDLYKNSKFGNVVFARELARRHGDKIVSTACNPGNFHTSLRRHMSPWKVSIVNFLILYPAEKGALTQLYAATASEGEDMNGQFLIPWARVGEAHPAAGDPAAGDKLWQWLEEQCKAYAR